ncbi:hypothetical protein JHK87_055963 [Glycine soja]|nr:hypothetical protein JHK87_055963 [Glycine soja]
MFIHNLGKATPPYFFTQQHEHYYCPTPFSLNRTGCGAICGMNKRKKGGVANCKDNDSLKKSSGSRDQKNDDQLPCPVLLPVVSAPIRTQYHGTLPLPHLHEESMILVSCYTIHLIHRFHKAHSITRLPLDAIVSARYLMFGEISAKAAHMLSLHKVSDFFTRLIQRISPKSYQQAFGEVYVTQMFLENLCGDQVRFLVRSFAVPGNHVGQRCHGFRWPYGPVTIITPFNFPLEIHALQLMGALYMANKPVLKIDSKEDYIAWVCHQDAYACSEDLAERRKLANLTIDSVLTVTTDSILEHVKTWKECKKRYKTFAVKMLQF